MDEQKVEDGRTIGSVKAAINMYGGKIDFHGPNSIKKPLKAMSDSKKPPSKTSELHLARKRVDQLNVDTKTAELQQSQAELQLLQAKQLVRGLTWRIEESKLKAKEQQIKAKPAGIMKDHDHEEVIREVEDLKRELSELNLDMARAVEEKARAEEEAEAASLRFASYISRAEKLRREIEEANEEEVLVELAKIQARKELAEIEDQREGDRDKLVSQIEEARKKICMLREEMERLKDLEEKLADTNADIKVLQNELNLIRETDERVERKNIETEKVIPKEELKDMKNELDSVQGEAFSMMSTIDGIRNELKEVLEEKERMLKMEEEAENSIRKLSSRIFREKDKLEAVTASEENEKLMFSNLSTALENLHKEREEAMKERESAQVEIASVRIEIQKTKNETDVMEERLSAVMQELAKVKLAEEKALKKLKFVAEKVAKGRASYASKKKLTITISTFEYNYLTGCALPAQEVAEKKIAAAYAWEKAVRDSEREMNIETELAKEELKELFLVEEKELQRMELSLNAKEVDEGEVRNQRRQSRKSMRENSYSLVPARQAKLRRSVGSPTARPRTSSLTLKRRRMVMLRLGKYFASKQTVNQKGVPSEEEV